MEVTINKEITNSTVDRLGRRRLGLRMVPLGPKNVRLYDYSETKVVEVVLVKENNKTIWVKLPDGNVIKRHRKKHLVGELNG